MAFSENILTRKEKNSEKYYTVQHRHHGLVLQVRVDDASNNSTANSFCFMSFQMFFKQSAILAYFVLFWF